MAILYLAYRKREAGKDLFEISVLTSSEKIEKDRDYSSHTTLKLETRLKPELAISQIKSFIFGNQEGVGGIYHKDELRIDESGIENELRLITPISLEGTLYSVFLEYVTQQIRERNYDKLSEG